MEASIWEALLVEKKHIQVFFFYLLLAFPSVFVVQSDLKNNVCDLLRIFDERNVTRGFFDVKAFVMRNGGVGFESSEVDASSIRVGN